MKIKRKAVGGWKIAVLATALCLMLFTLAACSGNGLNGTYQSTGTVAQTVTFSGSDDIAMSAFGINASGTYKIDGDKMTVRYSLFGINSDWTCTFRQNGNSIDIDGTEFVKQ